MRKLPAEIRYDDFKVSFNVKKPTFAFKQQIKAFFKKRFDLATQVMAFVNKVQIPVTIWLNTASTKQHMTLIFVAYDAFEVTD